VLHSHGSNTGGEIKGTMRRDLNKVLVERERVRSSSGFKDVRGFKEPKPAAGIQAWPFKGESSSPHPFKEGMKKPYQKKVWKKEFSENLNPLYGVIRKNVGQHWDKVYSQLSKNFDKRSVINQHILIHLFQFVEVNTFMHNGKVCYTNLAAYSMNKGITPITESGAEYYVHPISRVLLKNKIKSTKTHNREVQVEKKREEAKYLKALAAFNNKDGKGERWAIKINDIWFEVSIIPRPKPEKHSRVIDSETGKREYYTHYPTYNEVSLYGAKFLPYGLINETHYAARKQTMSSQAIRKHGLND
jgi:hypothetical protein